MRTIWKFPFEIKEFQQLDVPRGAKPLHVGLDPKGAPAIWFEVDPLQQKRPLVVYVIGTGDPVPPEAADTAEHIGTFMWSHTGTAYHVYTCN